MTDVRKSITQSIAEVKESKKGIRRRDAFGYMEPKGNEPNYAQCGTCRLWIKPTKRCFWYTDDKVVVAEASCILYVQGDPITTETKPIGAVTPEETGFINGKVRCENCDAFNAEESGCGVYYRMNEELPNVFDLDTKVNKKGCCNAFYRGAFRPKDFKEVEHEEG